VKRTRPHCSTCEQLSNGKRRRFLIRYTTDSGANRYACWRHGAIHVLLHYRELRWLP
jgi:hypothetical protein